ncbi:MAG: carboxypeptidase regulatory-like domain-containing protein [Pirellulaceae bacterium]|nr:carboxypeptidase regulatory-like domain-containing protein [Pirellulaceae bacterium]
MKHSIYAVAVCLSSILVGVVSHAAEPPDKPRLNLNEGAIRVQGEVRDAETGEPIKELRLIIGSPYNDIHTNWQGHLITEHADGRYEWFNRRPWLKTRLRIEADGYRPAISPTFTRDAGDVTMDFQLRPDKGIFGTVVGAQGDVVAGAEVAMATFRRETSVQNGKLIYVNGQRLGAELVLTDQMGKFRVPPEADPYLIVAAHREHGFGLVERATVQGLHKTNKPLVIPLEPWCRVEGQLTDNGKPEPNQMYQLYVGWQPKPEWPILNHRDGGTTDEQGRFVCERLAPGAHYIQRQINSGQGTELVGPSLSLIAVAGKTMRITIGNQQRSAVGRLVSFEGHVLPAGFAWSDLSVTIQGKSSRRRRVAPAWPNANEIQKIELADDGTFRVDGLRPGDLQIKLTPKDPNGPLGDVAFRCFGLLRVRLVDDQEVDQPHDFGDVRISVFPTAEPK